MYFFVKVSLFHLVSLFTISLRTWKLLPSMWTRLRIILIKLSLSWYLDVSCVLIRGVDLFHVLKLNTQTVFGTLMT